jgi:hypothetical protein
MPPYEGVVGVEWSPPIVVGESQPPDELLTPGTHTIELGVASLL